MAKKIINENGETFVAVKSWYQKWWIWLIIVLGALVLIGMFYPGDDSSSTQSADSATSTAKTTTKSSAKTSSKESTNKVYSVGQTATMNGIKLTVNSVKTASSFEDGDMTPKSGNQYYTINVTVKNTASAKMDYNSYDFQIDDNGNSTDIDEINSDDDNTFDSGTLTTGGSVTGDLIGQASKNGNIKLIYTPDSMSDEHLTFQIQ